MLEPRRRHELVVRELLKIIRERGLRPGQRLPTERELERTLGVSRNVIRQAFSVLEQRGLIRAVRGSGRYLRDAGETPVDGRPLEVASIADVLEARMLLEVEVVALACQRRTAEEARRIIEVGARLDTWEDNLTFHASIAAAAHNFVLERVVRELPQLAGELGQRERYEDREDLATMREEHQAIAAAISARDSDRARDVLHGHLDRTRRIVLGALRSTIGGE